MKSIVLRLVLALAAFTVVPNALAADSDSGNAFFDVKFGETFGGPGSAHSGYFSDSQSAWGADGGYRWKLDDARSVGFDVGYMHFGQVDDESDPMDFTSGEASASAITVGGNYRFLFGDDKAWYMQARVGLMSVKFDATYTYYPPNPPSISSDSWRHGGWYYGLGIGRHITQSFSLILAYDGYYSGDTGDQIGQQSGLNLGFLGLEAEFRF
jgi:opacity protein-like surface antigen